MSSKRSLQDPPILGAVEKRAPLFQFSHSIGGFLCVKLSHTPDVEKLPASHGVTEMRSPVVGGIHVAHGRGYPALRHDRARFPEKRLPHNPDTRPLPKRL